MPQFNDNYPMPRPYSLAVWRGNRDDHPCPALVTAIFDRTVSATVFPPDHKYGVPKDGVRHIDDPIAPHIDPADGGGWWDYTEDQKLLRGALGEDSASRKP